MLALCGITLDGTIKRQNHRWGPCPRCGGTRRFRITVSKQRWRCEGCAPKGGDAIDLLIHITGCTFVEAVERLNGGRVPVSHHVKPPAPRADLTEAERIAMARALWARRCAIAGTPAETYFRRARAILAPLPATVGYLPPSPPRYPEPAVICAFGMAHEVEPGVLAIADNAVRAVHLIKLLPDGSGKAAVEPAKLSFGAVKGSPIILAPPNDLLGLVLTEGPEEALVAHQATGLGAWASGGATFLPALADVVPSYIEVVTIEVDDNEAGRTNSNRLAAALHARDIEVLLDDGRPS